MQVTYAVFTSDHMSRCFPYDITLTTVYFHYTVVAILANSMESYVNLLHSYLKMNTLIQVHTFASNQGAIIIYLFVQWGVVSIDLQYTWVVLKKSKHVRRFPMAYSNRACLAFGTSLRKLPRIRDVFLSTVTLPWYQFHFIYSRVATGQGKVGNSRSGKSQGILEFVREIWNFVESQGNLRKVREIQLKASEI